MTLAEVSTTDGDYNAAKLSACVNTQARNATAVDAWFQHAHHKGKRSTLVFAVDVQHAKVCSVRHIASCSSL